MLKINTPFIKILLYVKLAGDNVCHLLELPDVEFPKFPKWGLGENDRNAPSDTEYHLGKNLTQYSYTGIKDFGYKKDLFRNFKMNISFLLCFII